MMLCPCCEKDFIPNRENFLLTDTDGHAITDNYSEDIVFYCPICKSEFYVTVEYETKINQVKLLEILENHAKNSLDK